MQWTLNQQAVFLRDHLYPAFTKAGLSTKVILFDHNADRPDYPLALLSDPVISQFADGSGFHHYGGDLSAMSKVHAARPDKNIYFTEQMITERPGSSTINIAASVKRMIDTTRNWAGTSSCGTAADLTTTLTPITAALDVPGAAGTPSRSISRTIQSPTHRNSCAQVHALVPQSGDQTVNLTRGTPRIETWPSSNAPTWPSGLGR
jgi:hypothetical protein